MILLKPFEKSFNSQHFIVHLMKFGVSVDCTLGALPFKWEGKIMIGVRPSPSDFGKRLLEHNNTVKKFRGLIFFAINLQDSL